MPHARIDVHAHFLPPFYRDALQSHGHAHPDGMPAHLLPPPPPSSPANLTRRCNAHAASLKQAHPDKIGFWASLPLPSVSDTLAEIETAAASGASGFGFMTNYQGRYLGDPAFDAVFAELNRRKAIIFIHPTTPCCPASSPSPAPIEATPLAPLYPNPLLEFFFDTARCVANLFLSGTVARYPDLTFIIPHCGGAFPPLLNRFVGFSGVVPARAGQKESAALDPDWVQRVLNERFYFDTAGFVFSNGEGVQSNQLEGLLGGCGIGKERLLYGSDYPFTPASSVERMAGQLDGGLIRMFGGEGVAASEEILRSNAERLLGSVGPERGEKL
ncbi:amidohydrolase 2 [Saccharata proteae CBS 121410]|uniref:6-methylsalicylate decarboxylase n=1 Tax=Saccharata proteae CBS 121410 TaxID=1314787 RepID=A0A9P4I0E5_9PEZI|nr:amidohydrolase 2 [Saccharata proteae CBS 121410]